MSWRTVTEHVTRRDIADLWRAVARHRAYLGDLEGATRARRAARLIEHRDGWLHPTMADLPAPQHFEPVTWNRYRDGWIARSRRKRS